MIDGNLPATGGSPSSTNPTPTPPEGEVMQSENARGTKRKAEDNLQEELDNRDRPRLW